jgi:hypothetical protein
VPTKYRSFNPQALSKYYYIMGISAGSVDLRVKFQNSVYHEFSEVRYRTFHNFSTR